MAGLKMRLRRDDKHLEMTLEKHSGGGIGTKRLRYAIQQATDLWRGASRGDKNFAELGMERMTNTDIF